VKTEFRKSFEKDLRKLRDPQVLARVKAVILDIESAVSLDEISNIKKLTAKGSFYRIRVGDYRIGIIAEGELVTFIRVLHRKEMYRNFP
jgi:mRNA interferase RelE/StbE